MRSKVLSKKCLVLLLAGLFAGCIGEIDDPMPEDIRDEDSIKAEDIVSPPSTDEKPDASKTKRRRARVVKRAAPLREKDFFLRYIREGYYEVALGQQTVLEILGMKGPTRDFPEKTRIPRDIMKIQNETLHMVQRSGRKFADRFFKDLEIFLVFKAAYDDMSHEARLGLVERWKKKYGLEPPPMPEGNEAPFAWLRSTELFWKKGGRFWWWAQGALLKEEGFRILENGRVVIDLPEFDRPYTS